MPAAQPVKTRYEGVHCDLTIESYSPDIVVLRISGTDVGEFGAAPLEMLTGSLAGVEQFDLFVDAREVRGASIEVSGDWAQWLRSNKHRLRDMSMLTGSRFVQVTADFVRRFADLEGVMQVYTDDDLFDAKLAKKLRS